MMSYTEPLLFEKGFTLTIREPGAPLYYFFDYDTRYHSRNMEFQHFHSFYEIHILLDGTADHIIEGEYFSIRPYDLVLLRPGRLHKTAYPVGAPRKRLVINFMLPADLPSLPGLQEALSVFDEPVPIYRFDTEARTPLFAALNEIFSRGHQPLSPLTELTIHAKFIEFLSGIALARQQNHYTREQPGDSVSQKIYAISSYIHTNCAQELSLDQLAHDFFISPCYLSRQFKRVTGFTLTGYIQLTRVRRAQQLLLYTDLRIAELASACGFTSFSQFNRVFHRFCQVSPSQYRQSGGRLPIPAPPD